MTKNELYEQAIERIAPKLEELKNKSFDEIIHGLYHEILYSPITRTLIFALTYVLDPSRFFIEVNHNVRGDYEVKFAADIPLKYLRSLVSIVDKSGKRPTDEEARDFIKEVLSKRGIEVEGLIEKAKEVVDTCKVIQGP